MSSLFGLLALYVLLILYTRTEEENNILYIKL